MQEQIMTVEAQAYKVNSKKDRWITDNKEYKTGNFKKLVEHAERKAYQSIAKADGPYLIVQNAFPCPDCDEYFRLESKKGKSFIIVVNGDSGNYSLGYKGLKRSGKELDLPMWIYFHDGKRTITTMDDKIPDDFPAHPDLP